MSLQLAVSARSVHPQEHLLKLNHNPVLESGQILESPVLAYQTWGSLNADRSNVVWVCHALTGNHRVHEWWGGLFGKGKCFDPKDWFIVAVNVPGSCYGSVGPLSFRSNLRRYFRDFPQVTVRDMVQLLDCVRQHLQLYTVEVLIGASLGGQQALEWAIQKPGVFRRLIPIATNAQHSPYGIAFNEAQRLAIQADPSFERDEYEGGRKGLIAARSIAMLSYRTYEGYALTQSEEGTDKTDLYKASSYQQYQGEKLANRFNAYSYWYLSKAMDSHHIGRGRKQVEAVLADIDIPALVVGIDSDILFPIQEQEFLATHLPHARLVTLQSPFGHDGFLVEFAALSHVITDFLQFTDGAEHTEARPATLQFSGK